MRPSELPDKHATLSRSYTMDNLKGLLAKRWKDENVEMYRCDECGNLDWSAHDKIKAEVEPNDLRLLWANIANSVQRLGAKTAEQ